MLVGRLFGWLLIGVSVLMASADAVMALGPGEHAGIVTRDVWMLLSGRNWTPGEPSLATLLMAWPAWTLLAPLGLLTVWLSRQRRRVRATGRRRFDD
jgi:hypothetical protein